jgi:hypothetical protein
MAVVTTNLIRDPSGEGILADGFFSSLGGATVGETTAEKHVGAQSVGVISAASADSGCRFNTASSLGITGAATQYAGSAYVKGAGNLYIQTTVVYGDATFTSATRTDFTATGTWTRISAGILTLNAAKTVDFMVVDVRNQDANSNTFYVDAVQLEAGAAATDWFNGDTTDTATNVYAWTGATNGSASTRTFTPASGYSRIRSQFELRPY